MGSKEIRMTAMIHLDRDTQVALGSGKDALWITIGTWPAEINIFADDEGAANLIARLEAMILMRSEDAKRQAAEAEAALPIDGQDSEAQSGLPADVH